VKFSKPTGEVIMYQIVRVNAGTGTISATSVPVWVVGGGGVTATIIEPSISGIAQVFVGLHYSNYYDASLTYAMKNMVFGIACGSLNVISAQGVACVAKCTAASAPIEVVGSSAIETQYRQVFVPTALSQEWGILGTNVADSCQFGAATSGGMSFSSTRLRGYCGGRTLPVWVPSTSQSTRQTM
jgi:hypothetical protein